MTRRPMPISRWWFQGAILTYLFGFTVLGLLAYLAYAEQPPIPARVLSERGNTIFTRQDVFDGRLVFQRYGLMEYGTIYGHGAYLGPDFTADYLHRLSIALGAEQAEQAGPVATQLHRNTFDAA